MNKKNIWIIPFVLMVGFLAVNAADFKLPKYETLLLKNGLMLYLMEQHETPMIYINTVFTAGSVNDGQKYGLASLTADALMFGTKSYSKAQLEETFEFVGASVNTYVAKEASHITLSFLAKDLETVLPVWQEIITQPTFDQTEFDKRKQRLLVELEQAKERPRSVMGDYYNKFLFGDHPYGNPSQGTIASVTALQVTDLKNFYEANYIPARAAIVIVGDFKSSNMKKKIQRLFESWKAKGAAPLVNYGRSVPKVESNRVLLVNKEDARQTTFYIGGHGVTRDNPDYIPIQVVNTILGGRFTSWLNDELRVNAGLTYGAGSRFAPYKFSGAFAITSFTPTPTTEQALDLALQVLNRLHEKGIDEETLLSAKKYMNGQFPPDYETAGQLANLLSGMYIYGFNEKYINDFQKIVDSMTVEKAREIVAKYFPRDKLQFVLIGKAADIRDKVKKYGALTEREITADGF